MPIFVYQAIGITGDVLASSGTLYGLEYWMNYGINKGNPYTVKRVKVAIF